MLYLLLQFVCDLESEVVELQSLQISDEAHDEGDSLSLQSLDGSFLAPMRQLVYGVQQIVEHVVG